MNPQPNGAETVDQDEVARFSRLAGEWWDPHGPMATLHKFNPVRLTYIRDRTAEHFGRDPKSLDSLSGLRFLDIGCGGRHPVRAAGAARRVGGRGRSFARRTLRWRRPTPRRRACHRLPRHDRGAVGRGRRNVRRRARHGSGRACHRCRPVRRAARRDGEARRAVVRRHAQSHAKSFALAIVGAEYILRWLPRGTHRWDKFVTPDELEIAIERGGLACHRRDSGVIYNLMADRWQLSRDTDVNYMVVAEKPA